MSDQEEYESPLESIFPKCQAKDCKEFAVYEGWYRVRDFAGITTGLVRRGYVCEAHKTFLIGGEKQAEQENSGNPK